MTATIATAERAAKNIKWEDHYTEPYPGKDDAEKLEWVETCGRCGGQGYIRAFAFNANGVCFDCNGQNSTYTVHTTVGAERAKAKKVAQREAGKARKAIRAQAKADQAEAEARDARVGRYPAMHLFTYEAIQTLPATEWEKNVLTDLRHKDREYGLSEKQVEFAARLLDGALTRQMAAPIAEQIKAQEEAAKVPAPEGRVTVTGTVVKAKDVDSYHGYTSTWTRKLIVETDEGWTLFVNCPRALEDAGYDVEEAEVEAGTREGVRRIEEEDSWTTSFWLVGRKVQMAVTVTRSDRDASQGFGKRPAKAELV